MRLLRVRPRELRLLGLLLCGGSVLWAADPRPGWRSEDPWEAGSALASAAGPLSADVEKALQEALLNGTEAQRLSAAVALLRAGEGAGADRRETLWCRALADTQAAVRWQAAVALGRLSALENTTREALRTHLSDTAADVRWAAWWALHTHGAAVTPRPETAAVLQQGLQQTLPALQTEKKVPGVSAVLWENGAVAATVVSGVKRQGEREPVTADTVFEACSMSKPVLAHLALKLVEAGRLELDTPLLLEGETVWIAPQREWLSEITVRHLLAHTSGLPNWRPGGEERPGALAVSHGPGTAFRYSGEGIYFLQRVVERVTGRSLADYAEETLFRPLGMTRTRWVWCDQWAGESASGHDEEGQPLPVERYRQANAAYSLYTTATDYARVMALALGGEGPPALRLAGPLQEEMRRAQVEAVGREVGPRRGARLGLSVYRCLGWMREETVAGPLFWHGGANRTGFRCVAQYDPASGRGVVILTNGLRGDEVWADVLQQLGDW